MLPLWVRLGLVVVICGSLMFARLAPPPRRPASNWIQLAALGLALLAWTAAARAVSQQEGAWAALLVAAGTEGVCVAVWLMRAPKSVLDEDSIEHIDDEALARERRHTRASWRRGPSPKTDDRVSLWSDSSRSRRPR